MFMFVPIIFIGLLCCRALIPSFVCGWIIVGSLFFYGFHGWKHVPLLVGSICLNYLVGLGIEKETKNSWRSFLLVLGVSLNLGVLALFKYADFIFGSLGFGGGFGLALPLAISFFTFQQIAYLVDLKRGILTGPSFGNYALYISFFPQLIAGPIVRCQQIIPQLKNGLLGKLTEPAFWTGFCFFAIGLFKKSCLADGIRPLAEPIFFASAQGVELTIIEAWIAACSFGLQIYFDFSAYSDMAIGLGFLCGIRLPINFDSPYKATSIVDFWRRWHITLSEFLRDYLYKPLGGNRYGVMRSVSNALIVMVLGGLWHGAAWTFVIWGLVHGLYIAINHIFRAFFRPSSDISGRSFLRAFLGRSITFIAVSAAWVFFRSEEFGSAISMVQSMFGINGIDLPRTLDWGIKGNFIRFEGLLNNEVADITLIPFLFLLLGVVWILPNSANLLRLRHAFELPVKNPSRKIVFFCGILLFWGIKVSFESSTHEFLYFRF